MNNIIRVVKTKTIGFETWLLITPNNDGSTYTVRTFLSERAAVSAAIEYAK